MADSAIFRFKLPQSAREELAEGTPPTNVKEKVDRSTGLVSTYAENVKVFSPITNAQFLVKAIHSDEGCQCLMGFDVEINPPACLVGPNHLLVNGVPFAAKGALWLLKAWLAKQRFSRPVIDSLDVEHSELLSVTCTFLFPCEGKDAAFKLLQEFKMHSEGALNQLNELDSLIPENPKPRQPRAFSVGSSDSFTAYVKERLFTVSAYVKNEATSNASQCVKDSDVMRRIRSDAERTLRLEVKVNHAWLRKHDLSAPLNWKGSTAAYEKVFRLARDILRLDDGLRVNMPSEETILSLHQPYQDILRCHLAGENIRHHPHVLYVQASTPKETRDKQSKKFSFVRKHIFSKLGVDLEVPWERQSTYLSPRLKKLLTFPGEYVPDDDFAAYVFSRVSVPARIEMLKGLVGELLA